MVEPRVSISLLAGFRWTTTALDAFIQGFERSEVRGLLVTGAGFVVADAGL